MASYDLASIFSEMELDLIASYKKNMARHTAAQVEKGFEWKAWQQLKLQDIRNYQKECGEIVNSYSSEIADIINSTIPKNFKMGTINADEILKDIKADLISVDDDNFFKLNKSKINALTNAISNDLKDAQNAVLRMVDDIYRQTIYKAQIFYSSGTTSLWQAVDMASKDFLSAGINCIQYKNGARVNVASYAEMALRTSAKKANLVGEGNRQAEYGVYLVQVTQYSSSSPICLPWQGKIYVDDVYAGGKPDGKHTLLSTAISAGLFHPHCRHTKQPYYDGISELPNPVDSETNNANYKSEQQQRAIERNIRKSKRVAAGSLDPDNQNKALLKVNQYQAQLKQHLAENPQLRRENAREKVAGYGKGESQKAMAAKKELEKVANSMYNKDNISENVKAYLRDQPIRDKILSSKQIKTIDAGKQDKHIKENNNYIKGRSYLIISMDEAQNIINKYAGTGTIERDLKGKWTHKELIEANIPIGYTVNLNGDETMTAFGKIHYSKSGTHIVPTIRKVDEIK